MSSFSRTFFNAEKDVVRTDRGEALFLGDTNPNLKKLFDMLMTYAFYNMDIGEKRPFLQLLVGLPRQDVRPRSGFSSSSLFTGYCQGETDFAAPFLQVFPDDPVMAFWCFASLMDASRTSCFPS